MGTITIIDSPAIPVKAGRQWRLDGDALLGCWTRNKRSARRAERLFRPPALRYSLSPTTGCPMLARCTRIWCVRPVPMRTSRYVNFSKRRDTRYSVSAERPLPSFAVMRMRPDRIARNRRRHPPLVIAHFPMNQRQISFLYRPARELRRQRPVRGIVASHQQNSASAFVQTMHNARTQIPADLRERREMMHEAVHQCSGTRPRPRVHHQPRRLVDRNHGSVLIQDIERQVLRRGFERHRIGRRDLDALPAAQHQRRFSRRAIHQHPALFDPALQARTAELGHVFLQKMVQPFPGVPGQSHDDAVNKNTATSAIMFGNVFTCFGRPPETCLRSIFQCCLWASDAKSYTVKKIECSGESYTRAETARSWERRPSTNAPSERSSGQNSGMPQSHAARCAAYFGKTFKGWRVSCSV